jgi:ABC-2 type transport system ATP-binding protein
VVYSPAVRVEGVSKHFRLYHDKYTSLKERALHLGKVPYEEFWALSEINFEINEGQTLGMLGRNGSGKSTLLKCIAGILKPSSGRVVVRGQLAAMLELGAGFHPELSGRDNVFLNASLLGMGKKEIERRFDDIVAFAELETFIDNQVKYYSSGMYTRLGFAVAVNVDPDVLLIDEVLAVGDEPFQRKCLARVKQFQEEGRTIVLVSHSADSIRQICDSAIVLDQGKIVAQGTAGEAIRAFRQHLLETGDEMHANLLVTDEAAGTQESTKTAALDRSVTIQNVLFEHADDGGTRPYLLPGEAMTVRVEYTVKQPVTDPVFTLEIHDAQGSLIYGADTDALGEPLGFLNGKGYLALTCESLPLLDGTYNVSVGVRARKGEKVYDWKDQVAQFQVMNPDRTRGSVALPFRVDTKARAPGRVQAG